MLRYSAPQYRFEIGDVSDVEKQIDTLHKCAHCVVRRIPVGEKNDEVFSPQGPGFSHHLAQDRVFPWARPLKVLVNDDHVVTVSRKLKKNVVFEKTEMH